VCELAEILDSAKKAEEDAYYYDQVVVWRTDDDGVLALSGYRFLL